MQGARYLVQRPSGFYLRVAVPEDLRLFLGVRELTRALNSRNRREAIRRCRRIGLGLRALFDDARLMSKDKNSPLTPATFRAWVLDFLRSELDRFDTQVPSMRLSEREGWETAAEVEVDALLGIEHDERRPTEESDALAEAVLAGNGVAMAELTPELRTSIRHEAALARAHLCVMKAEAVELPPTYPVRRRLLRDWEARSTPSLVDAPLPLTKHTVEDLFNSWQKAVPNRPPKTISKYRRASERLAELVGEKAIEDITKDDGRDIRDALVAEAHERGGKAMNTAALLFQDFKTLFNQAVERGWIPANPLPAKGIPTTQSDRMAWTREDLPRLFDDPLFLEYRLPVDSMAGMDAAYWLPVIGLFTGARISELAQLTVDDILRDKDGGWVFRLDEDEAEDKRLKTATSRRDVPIHSELVRLGLLDYWGAIKEHGRGPLWPALPRTRINGAGGKISQWFGRYKTAKGFGPELVFHSFRHTMETELRHLMIPGYLIDGITGHGKQTVADGYAHTTALTLRQALERLQFPEVNLPRVFTRPAWRPE